MPSSTSSAGRLADFDRAYANGASIPRSERFPDLWLAKAARFRDALENEGRAALDQRYGGAPRERYDLFSPRGEPEGTLVFVHGGYWKSFDRSSWSHLARGALERDWAVAMPSYTLCPDTTVTAIGQAIARFLDHLDETARGPISLAGHSAGGQLVARMVAEGSPLGAAAMRRISAVAAISGVHDLRPIRRTAMNEVLGIDAEEARCESPALLEPRTEVPVLAVVGAEELGEFRRQTAAFASLWQGLGASVEHREMPGRHHFDVVDELEDPASPLVGFLTGATTR